MGVEVIGGLVNEGISASRAPAVFPGEKGSQQRLGLLALGEGGEGPIQHRIIHLELIEFADQLPFFRVRRSEEHHVAGVRRHIRYGVGEIHRRQWHVNMTLIRKLLLQQPQKGGLALAVAADQAETPGRIKVEAHVFKNGGIGAVISKGQITDRYLHTGVHSLLVFRQGRREDSFVRTQKGGHIPDMRLIAAPTLHPATANKPSPRTDAHFPVMGVKRDQLRISGSALLITYIVEIITQRIWDCQVHMVNGRISYVY